jgi:hypothetical protein
MKSIRLKWLDVVVGVVWVAAMLAGLATAYGQVTDVPTLVNTQVANTGVPQTILVLQNPGAGRYTLTNTVIGTNTSTRLASVAHPGYSWDLQGVTFADGTALRPSPEFNNLYPFVAANGQKLLGFNNSYSAFYAGSIIRQQMTNTADIKQLEVYLDTYDNQYGANGTYGGEQPTATAGMTNGVDVAVSLLYPANTTNGRYFTWTSGKRWGFLPNGGQLQSLKLTVDIPSNSTFCILTAASRLVSSTNQATTGEFGNLPADAGGLPYSRPILFGSRWSNGMGVKGFANNTYTNTGTNLFLAMDPYMTGKTAINGSDQATGLQSTVIGYGPIAGYQNSLLVMGDSIVSVDEAGSSPYGLGFFTRAFGPTYNVLTLGESSELLANWFYYSGNANYRSQFLNKGAHVIMEHGVNDLGSGTNAANLQALMIKGWFAVKTRGGNITQLTLLPRSGNTNTTQGATNFWLFPSLQDYTQSPGTIGYHTNRLTVNQWLRAGAPIVYTNGAWVVASAGQAGAVYAGVGQSVHPLSGVIDWCPLVETATDSGLWKAGGAVLYSGTLTSGTTTTSAIDSGATFPTTGQGLIGSIFYNVTRGKTGVINANSTATTLALNQTITSQASGDSYQVIQAYTFDGIHPSGYAINVMITNAATVFPTNSAGNVIVY